MNAHPENDMGIMTMSGSQPQVILFRTHDASAIVEKLDDVSPFSSPITDLSTAVNIALLAFRGTVIQPKIFMAVGSPVTQSEEELVRIGTKVKSHGVSLDVVSLGELRINEVPLTTLVDAANDDAYPSHYIPIPPGVSTFVARLLQTSFLLNPSIDHPQEFPARILQAHDDRPNPVPRLRRVVRFTESMGEEEPVEDEVSLTPQPAPLVGKGSMVPLGAEPIWGAEAAAYDDPEDVLVRQALALASPSPSSPRVQRSSVPSSAFPPHDPAR